MTERKISSLTITISMTIVLGFILSGLSSVFLFQDLFKKDIEAVSELTSQNIFVNINNLMDRPINVSIAMAHDTFLRDFAEKESSDGFGASDLDAIQEYLRAYKNKYNFDSVFFISTKTGAYYHYKNGIDRFMSKDNPENTWYFDFLKEEKDCSLNVDNDEAKNNVTTIFVNCKLYNKFHDVVGVVGVGMETPYIQGFLTEHEEEYGVSAYLIDTDGKVQLSSNLTGFENVNLFEKAILADMKNKITLGRDVADHKWYHTKEADGYIITKYVPNLNWYLVVLKDIKEFKERMFSQLAVSFLFLIFVVLAVVNVTTGMVKKYSIKMAQLAETDRLTGIRNRASYEYELTKVPELLGTSCNFGIGVFDLNKLKAVNDTYGHQAGDEYIKKFAKMLGENFETSQVFRIGGDEFAVIFRDLTEAEVYGRWEKLRDEMKSTPVTENFVISAAFGCAFWDGQNLDTVEKIFKAADDNMYLDKEKRKK